MADEKAITALNARVQNNAKVPRRQRHPDLLEINGRKMEPGYHSLAEIDAAIENTGK
ncbi:hypothetical protein ACRAWD_13175 [Caulobacter segnis]